VNYKWVIVLLLAFSQNTANASEPISFLGFSWGMSINEMTNHAASLGYECSKHETANAIQCFNDKARIEIINESQITFNCDSTNSCDLSTTDFGEMIVQRYGKSLSTDVWYHPLFEIYLPKYCLTGDARDKLCIRNTTIPGLMDLHDIDLIKGAYGKQITF